MKNIIRTAVFTLAAVLPLLGSAGLRITVSIPPFAQFAEKVAGPGHRISVMIPDNQAPNTYSPSPRQMMDLEKADLYISIGMPQYPMETRFIYPFLKDHPDIRHIRMSESIQLLPALEHDHHDEHADELGDHGKHEAESPDRSEYDPHIWLGPDNVLRFVLDLRDLLMSMDPENADLYRINAENFSREIRTLQLGIREQLSELPSRKFMVYHPAWSYFAEEFGLQQVAIEQAGKEPGPRQLMDIIESARREKIPVIFVQKGFSTRSASVIAREVGAGVLELNPLDEDWLKNLQRTADTFRQYGGTP